MRILLDTNILIPLEDSSKILGESYANFSRLASANGHKLLVHPASIDDINRDKDDARRSSTLSRLEKYPRLEQCTPCPWNTATTSDNDRADNEILFAVFSDAVHALVTQDAEIHKKAKERGLRERVHYIQAAEDLLHRLHALAPVALPSISDVAMHTLTAELPGAFFDSLRQGYDSVRFNKWFADKARDGRCAWVYRNEDQSLGAICIYALQENERVCDDGSVLAGRSLKLCTFKVGDSCRGRKIGELFLKAAFRYATSNAAEHVFIEVQSKEHAHLLALLDDFGFRQHGLKNADAVFVKKHPIHAPAVEGHAPFEYHKAFFPHFVADAVRRVLGAAVVSILVQRRSENHKKSGITSGKKVKLIFVGGIHGAGKTTLCKAASTALGIEHRAASSIIREHDASALPVPKGRGAELHGHVRRPQVRMRRSRIMRKVRLNTASKERHERMMNEEAVLAASVSMFLAL